MGTLMRTLLFAVALAGCAAVEAAAQSQACALRKPIVDNLLRIYGEERVAVGLSRNGYALEVFAAPDGATFTILHSWSNGIACILDDGENWRAEPADAEPQGDPI